MHKLFAKLLAKATDASGQVDVALLTELMNTAFEEADKDRRRTDRSIQLMIEELDQLTRGLEKTVQQRTRELEQRERELRAQNERFDAAVNHMSHGLAMFDREGRVVICNQRYFDMYKLSPDQVRPGFTIRELLQLRMDAGTFAGNPADGATQLANDLVAGRLATRTTELPDGRTISICRQRTPDGGWVATHQDVTMRSRAPQAAAPALAPDMLVAAE